MSEQIDILDKALANLHQRYDDNSWHLFMWGTLSLIGCFFHYFYIYRINITLMWEVIMGVGIAVEMFIGFRRKTRFYSQSILEKAIGLLWILLCVSVCFTAFFAPAWGWVNWYAIIPLVMVHIWIALLFTGLMIKFWPVIILSNIWIIMPFIVAYLSDKGQVLAFAACVIVGFLLPGYLLKKECQRQDG